MSETPTIQWDGETGKQYKYWIYPIGHELIQERGNYVFAKQTEANKYRPIYAGETEDLSTRFDNHHKMPCILLNGATHICAHINDAGERSRRTEEQDIIAKWQPTYNG